VTDRILVLVIAVFFGVATMILLLYALAAVRRARPTERDHMDPLPGPLRMIWPAVNVVQFYVREAISPATMFKTRRRLQMAGLEYMLRPEDFVAVQVVSAGIFCAIGLLVSAMLDASGGSMFLMWMVMLCLGWIYPRIWAAECKKRRLKEVLRTLPGYLDLITLCCHAGLGLTSAIAQAVDKAEDGVLRRELDRVLRDMRAGMSRSEALKAMAARLEIEHVSSLVSTLIQAEAMGASVSETLSKIADQRRNERFQLAEKLAMEAPVKMIGPLVMFIFPVTFVIIFFPIVVQFLEASAG
jgi:tight adherence protein C